ncbi:hypothetical protein BDB00DRAFT_771960 [Zychaea mexicana]|uniref:uncharacterized protein n=1 Tax=Zychaea mexicana TaxID=64656 RepID=UPI0022FE3C6E|nr:uncharacterized protein BDB00DRAFT_771960 [Zychaea mexicana]KAI9488762.1 hypothetical protein BDB00DRAFT_771960 [Zychaea mexicana]
MTSVEAFTKWSAENGIKAPHVHVAKTENAGYGLFADQDFALNDNDDAVTTNDPLVHIPRDLLITSVRALIDNPVLRDTLHSLFHIGDNNSGIIEKIASEPKNERLSLRLFLALQKFSTNEQQQQSPTPFWKPYIDILPSLDEVSQQHPLFLINDESKSLGLDGTNLSRSIRAKRSALVRELELVKTVVEWMTLDMWMWADIVFWSRVVSLEHGDLALIPFFDFANHSSQPNIRWCPSQDGGIDFVPYTSSTDHSTLLAGNELLLSYGDKSNQELLFLHGFTLNNNPEPSRVTLPVTGFLDMSIMESQVKLSWISQSAVKPVLTLMGSTLLDSSKGDDTTTGKTGENDKEETTDLSTLSTGWTTESIALMYLVALDQDDGLTFELCMIIQASLANESVEDLDDLVKKVGMLDHSAVICLRVVMLLLDALEYHLQMIQSSSFSSSTNTEMMTHIERYKQDEMQLLQRSIEKLATLRDTLMTHDTVVVYLAAQDDVQA